MVKSITGNADAIAEQAMELLSTSPMSTASSVKLERIKILKGEVEDLNKSLEEIHTRLGAKIRDADDKDDRKDTNRRAQEKLSGPLFQRDLKEAILVHGYPRVLWMA